MIIRASINVIGKPANTVKEFLEGLLNKLKEQRKILDSKILKPEKAGKSMFSGFLEIETEISDFSDLIGFILDYNPVVVEIIEPDLMEFSIEDMQAGISDLVARIQEYEDGIKALRATNLLLQRELKKNSSKKSSNAKK